jgi:hypothetical protein
MPSQGVDLFACLHFGRLRNAAMWKMVPLCPMWCLWREINDWCFEDRDTKEFFLEDSFYPWTAVLTEILLL